MKRVLWFVLLLCAGSLAMYLAIGDEGLVRAARDRGRTGGKPEQDPARPQGGLTVQQGKINATVSQRGALVIPRYRTHDLPDGTKRHEEIFTLRARDSMPVRDGLQQLDGVEVDLFDDGVVVAKLTAERAFLELARDSTGNLLLREDKQVDLRGCVLLGMAGSRIEGLRLDLGNARATVREDELQLDTASPDEPVALTLEGERTGRLTGRGLHARIPRQAGGGAVAPRIEILRDVAFVGSGLAAKARGRLRYEADPRGELARLSLDDGVELELLGGGPLHLPGMGKAGADAVLADGKLVARGDRLQAWLWQRGVDRRHERGDAMAWQRVLLVGAPTTVDGPGLRLRTPQLDVLAGPLGEPGTLLASGASSVDFEVPGEAGKPAVPVTGTTPTRLVVVRPAAGIGADLRSLGFPAWTLRPLLDLQATRFAEASRLSTNGRQVDASRGILVATVGTNGEHTLARGFGHVRLEQAPKRPGGPPQVATGSDGCELLREGTRERLSLGTAPPADLAMAGPWIAQDYELEAGTARLRGRGACSVERAGDRTRVELRAHGPDIGGSFVAEGLDVAAVRALDLELAGEELATLFAAGAPATVTVTRGGQSVTLTAPVLERTGPGSLRLLPPSDGRPPAFWRDLAPAHRLPRVDVALAANDRHGDGTIGGGGPRIDLHHAGGEHLVVDMLAVADEPVRAHGSLVPSATRSPTTVRVAAQRLRLLPFLLAPDVALAHGTGAIGRIHALLHQDFVQPWLLADVVHEIEIVDAEHGVVRGRGHRVLLSQRAMAGLFLGDASTCTPAVVTQTRGGRTVTMHGARIRAWQADAPRLAALPDFVDGGPRLWPRATMHQPGSSSALAHLDAECDGDIAVGPEAVDFGGPVRLVSLFPDGRPDPLGMRIDAKWLQLVRSRGTGDVVEASGRRVMVAWQGVRARSATADIDLRRRICRARDPEGAEVVLRDGSRFVAPTVEVNYETMRVSCFRGHFVAGPPSDEVQR